MKLAEEGLLTIVIFLYSVYLIRQRLESTGFIVSTRVLLGVFNRVWIVRDPCRFNDMNVAKQHVIFDV